MSNARDEDLRHQAFDLIDEGWTSEEAAELLELNPWTVRGWMSWRTKGHYEHEEAARRRRGAPKLHVVK